MKKSFLIFLSALLLTFTACFTSCDSWMSDDDFYGEIENDVKVANAAAVSVYVRYANSKMGNTDPSGYTTLKVDVPSTLTAVTNDDYGFVRWAAYSTSDFPTNQQHSNLLYENEDHYAENYLPLELPASEVFFSDPQKNSTKVTLYTTRSDIFIMPLVAKRPTVVTSVPSNGRTDVVKNSQIRILFSKPIDESTLVDEFGNSNIQVTSGRAVLTESSDDLSALDITNYFNYKLSKTKKMLTISAKKDSSGKAIYKFDNNSQISVTLFEDLKDSDGFTMNGSYKFSFTTGTKEDSLAPRIDNLTAGIGQECLVYQQYKYDNTVTNDSSTKYSILAQNAPATLSAYVTESNRLKDANKVPLLTQRVKDKLNIFIRATDIAGAGAAVTLDSNNQSENDVALLQIRATRYANIDGSSVTTSETAFANGSIGTDTTDVLYIREYGYALGMKDSDCQVTGAFETVTATQQDPNNAGTMLPNTSGTLLTYDLSTLDDGLIKIDIWAVDMVGNSGDTEAYAGTYDNGYRSIFVVKDHTAPVAATEVSKIKTESGNTATAPYEWYNQTSLSQVKVKDEAGTANLIHDANNEFLRSDDNKLKWIFKVGNDPSWSPSPTDSGWVLIHNDSNAPVPKTLSDAVSSVDGPVNVTMCLMDDLGNVSAPVLLNSINYDNTAPVLSTPGWVKNTSTVANTYTYEPVVATTDNANLATSGHILKIPFTEEWAGIRRVKVTVNKVVNNTLGDAVSQDGYTIRYVPSTGTARNLSFTGSSDLKTFSGSNSEYNAAPVKTGDLYISGLKIGDENGGTYRVTVDLWDSSLNHSVTTSDIYIDKTAPVIEKVYIPELKHSISVTSSGIATTAADHWFLPHEYIRGPGVSRSTSSVASGYIPLYLFVKEADSGIHKISFASTGNVTLFNSDTKKTTLWKLDSYGATPVEVPSSDYTVDPSTKTIELVNNPSVKLSSSDANGFVILIKDIGFSSYSTSENQISVTVEDLATLKHIETNSPVNNYKSTLTVDLTAGTTASGVYADAYLNFTPSATLKDRGPDAAHLSAVDGYTNEAIINLSVTLSADSSSASASSGHNKITISGASFINDGSNNTVVKVGNVTIPYELSADKKTITLRNKNATTGAFTNDYIVIRDTTPVEISNVLLDDSDQASRTVNVSSYDLAGWVSNTAQPSIIFDEIAPQKTGGPFTAYRNESHLKNVYPHCKADLTSETQTGIVFNGVSTFFTNTKIYSNATDSDPYSVALGIHATDTVSLYGTQTETMYTTFLRYYKHGNSDTTANVNKEKIITYGTQVTSNTNIAKSLWARTTGTNVNTENDSLFHIGFDEGTYSAVIVDKAGNCSDVFHFAIVADTTNPVVTDMQKRVLLERPSGSDIYIPDNTVVANDLYDSSVSIRTKKYVTKKITSNYQIILNLGATYGASSLITKISGAAPESVDAYTELNATASSSPIEKYTIATNYSQWPDSDSSTVKYEPSADDLVWKNLTTSDDFTDDCDGIQSKVDGNNNLIIKLPNNRSIPIISVFLKDACGNSSYIVLGNETTSGKETAPSFIVDDRLGYQPTDANGETTTPAVLQFPYTEYKPSATEYIINWGNKKFQFGDQSGNTTIAAHDGVGSKYGFMKDRVQHATYYNTAIGIDTPEERPKLGLSIHYTGSGVTKNEPATFDVTETTKGDSSSYTVRALLYCSQNANKPTRETILACLEAERVRADNEKTGQVTEWSYVKENDSVSEARLLIDYPCPNYKKLNWTVNNTDKTPKPYYIWYLFEDRVGNYEIAKVVNSKASGSNLISSTDDTIFDRWLYDGDGPVLAIRGTITDSDPDGTSPSEITNTPADVARLIATNNGYRPYLKPGTTEGSYSTTVFIHSAQGYSGDNRANLRNASLENTNAPGFGTTHYTESWGTYTYSNNRKYENFVDLEVSELTGIRAFAWNTSANPPDYTYNERSSGVNTHGYNVWYGGYDLRADYSDIGCAHNYGGSTGDKTNTYFSFTDSSSLYYGKYSGTKVNTVIPYELLASTAARNVYLHVMDWTGNISTYRIGQNLQFQNDIETPDIPGSFAGHAEPNQYYLSKNSSEPILIRIAGKGTYALAHSDINVNIPGVADSALWGSGIKGISFKGINEITNDEWTSLNNGAYIKLDYNTYSAFSTTDSGASEITYYVYDNVGNVNYGTFKGVFDADPPELTSVTIDVGSSGVKMFAAEDTAVSTSKTYNGYADFYVNAAAIPSDKLHTVYINSSSAATFTVTLPATVTDLESIKVYKWDNSNADSSKWKWLSQKSIDATSSLEYTISSTDISYTTAGTIFQILATDISGNTSCQYFKLYLDNVAPAFEVVPTVTIRKGSVNKDASSDVYYYTADDTHKMTVNFTLKDENGIGSIINSNSNVHYYYRVGSSGDYTQMSGASVELPFTNETVKDIYVYDALGNVTSKPLKYVYGTNQSGQPQSVEISELKFYDSSTNPAITYTAKAGWENNYQDNSASILSDGTGVRVLSKWYNRLQLSFTKPSGIIGYVSEYSDAIGAYSMKTLATQLSNIVLPDDKSDINPTFYAIDYAGQPHPVNILITFNNPDAAQDIVFLPAADVPTDVATSLGVDLTPTVDNGTTRYYKNGWIVVRCTLKKNTAGTGYSATPTTVKLYETNSITSSTQPKSTHTGTTDLKTCSTTTSPEGVTDRYYYYLAFKLSDSHKDKTLYCVMTDASNNTSDATALGSGVTWKQDAEAPTITDEYVITESSINKLKGFVLTKSDNTVISEIGKARDSFKGQGFQSNIYPSGAKVFFRMRRNSSTYYIKDNSGTIAKYMFVITEPEDSSHENFNAAKPSATATGWKTAAAPAASGSNDIFEGNWCYQFELPDVTSPHCHLALFLMDSFGNVSDPYYLIHKVDDNLKVQWWLKESTLSDYTYSKSSDNKTISIKLPLGTVVSNISATGATISSIEFTDYTKGQPALSDISQGWIVLKDSDSVGLKVNFSDYTAAWIDTDVKLKINDVEKTVHTIPAKTLQQSNINLKKNEAAMNGANLEIPVELTDGAPATSITNAMLSVTPNSVTATWDTTDSNNYKIILSQLPAASWDNPQSLFLTINSWEMGKVWQIDQLTLQEGQFELKTPTAVGATYEIPVELATGVPTSAITSVTATNSVTATWDSTNKKIVLSSLPAASWDNAIEIGLTVNSYNKGTVVTIDQRTIHSSDITLSDLTPTALADNTTSVTFKLAKTNSSDDITINSVTVDASIGTISGPANGVYTLTAGEGAKITGTPQITVATNHGEVTKTLYGTDNANIKTTGFGPGGITAITTGGDSGETGSRITQFFNNVANVFVQDSVVEKPVTAQEKKAAKKAEKEAKALAKAAKKATKKAAKNKASAPATVQPEISIAAETSQVVVPELDTATEFVTTELSSVTASVSGAVESAPVQPSAELTAAPAAATVEQAPEEKSSSPAVIVVMLAILASCAGTLFTLKARKRK